MERISTRSIAAALAAVVTLSGLMGIAKLARVESSAGMPVVVLERVEVVASRTEIAQPLLAESNTEATIR